MHKFAVFCVLATFTVLARSQLYISVNGDSSVQSTNWPQNYLNEEIRRWTFQGVDSAENLHVHFDSVFSLEPNDPGECYDFVAIYDGITPPAKVCDRYVEASIKACGSTPPADFETTGSTIAVDFCTDKENTETGFKLTVSQNANDPTSTTSAAVADNTQYWTQLRPQAWEWPLVTGMFSLDIFAFSPGTTTSCGEPDANYPPALIVTNHTIVGMSQVHMHALYGNSLGNDIALIKLATPATITPKVKPICLPTSSDSWRDDNTTVVVSGWGRLSEGGSTSHTLQHVVLQCDITHCVSAFQSLRPIADNEMCAYGPGKDSCEGDSGGPLIARKNGRYVLAGVVSSGHFCARDGYPGVYAHVPYYRDWIQQKSGL